MNLLLLETATSVCSVAIAKNDRVLNEIHSEEMNAHSSKLNVFINELFNMAGMKESELDAVCISAGPGSYTGLRIGTSSAKGICYALGIPLVSVPTLMSMAEGYFLAHPDYKGYVCPMIDARRMECYTAIYSRDLAEHKPTSADIVTAGCYDQWLNEKPVAFIGDGARKTKDIIGVHVNAFYDDDFQCSANFMLPIALQKIAARQTENVAYYEPYYLKDFVAKKSVVHGLHG
ncbi:MAG: tRNA (adenosine(37)-N6)-threonylcarbamoyltransferase complex dimerization subunit type 1 TsaB [Bacteroidales bacterium]|nr:tRNA (adenosine(37)-N6)-threonylcarbamoyltransferase complex dimerization subunit type 1 TsaB [Bacteroidales bacterium]